MFTNLWKDVGWAFWGKWGQKWSSCSLHCDNSVWTNLQSPMSGPSIGPSTPPSLDHLQYHHYQHDQDLHQYHQSDLSCQPLQDQFHQGWPPDTAASPHSCPSWGQTGQTPLHLHCYLSLLCGDCSCYCSQPGMYLQDITQYTITLLVVLITWKSHLIYPQDISWQDI